MPRATARQIPPATGYAQPPGGAAAVRLADRIAGTLVTHEPGWVLPRPSQLARKHNVSTGEVNAALDHLIFRQLVRRAPDGSLHRSSQAEFLIPAQGIPGLGGSIDPMDGTLTCLSCKICAERAPEDAAAVLGIPAGEPVGVIRLRWALDGAPAAVTTTFLAGLAAEPRVLAGWLAAATSASALPLTPAASDDSRDRDPGPGCAPSAVAIQMQPPSAAVARQIGLRPGQMAVLVTTLVPGDHPGRGQATLTVAVLRPDMFRITVQSGPPARAARLLRSAWSLAAAAEH